MIFERFFNDELAQASFLIGCGASGEAIVVDPNRHVEDYILAAEAKGLRIVAVTETHIHADYLSGSRELASVTGAKLYLSDEGTADWKYGFGPAILLKHGDHIQIGAVRLDVLRTPGHTPEHISFLVTDASATDRPAAMLSGDFIFVGDVGRPDLLETAAGVKGSMEPAARTLYQSLQRLLELPNELVIWPGHGAGSACGKSLGGAPYTTLADERATNWGLQAKSEASFVADVLSGQPEPPTYFAVMKRLNKQGPPLRDTRPLRKLHRGQAPEGIILDIRPSEQAAKSHPKGALHIPLYRTFVTWAGWFVPYDRPIVLLAESETDAIRARNSLALIGLDDVAGWTDAEAMDSAETKGWQKLDPSEALSRDDLAILDVRGQAEWQEGHLAQAIHIPLGYLPERAAELSRSKPIAVHCGSGGRSPIAASLLQSMGFEQVFDIPEGYDGLSLLRPKSWSR